MKSLYQSKLSFKDVRCKQREKEGDTDEGRKIISCPLTWF